MKGWERMVGQPERGISGPRLKLFGLAMNPRSDSS